MQKVVSKTNGDCARAVLASLYDLKLEDVPADTVYNDTAIKQVRAIEKFMKARGREWNPCGLGHKDYMPLMLEAMRLDGGVDGYFYAVVPSQTLEGVTHAVVIDIEGNIVHDPNPNQLALNLTFEDVRLVYLNVDVVMSLEHNKTFLMDEWNEMRRRKYAPDGSGYSEAPE